MTELAALCGPDDSDLRGYVRPAHGHPGGVEHAHPGGARPHHHHAVGDVCTWSPPEPEPAGPLMAEFAAIGLKTRHRSASAPDRAYVQHLARSVLIARHRDEYEAIEDGLRLELGMPAAKRRPGNRATT